MHDTRFCPAVKTSPYHRWDRLVSRYPQLAGLEEQARSANPPNSAEAFGLAWMDVEGPLVVEFDLPADVLDAATGHLFRVLDDAADAREVAA